MSRYLSIVNYSVFSSSLPFLSRVHPRRLFSDLSTRICGTAVHDASFRLLVSHLIVSPLSVSRVFFLSLFYLDNISFRSR